MDYPQRKAMRLPNYDYAQPGAYFITICTKDRKNTLGKHVGDDAFIVPQIQLSKTGESVNKYLQTIPGIDKYVIMPNHLHFIILIPSDENGSMWASTPTQSIPQRINSFKGLVTKEVGQSVFQRGYYDHIIRNQQDYLKVWNYIDTNPMEWKKDRFYQSPQEEPQ